jgi:tetratricopeptide (TPR) repeat protein
MKYLILFFTFTWLGQYAQSFSVGEIREIDSLKMSLIRSKNDTDKINLRNTIGEKCWIYRLGYWDTLREDAHALKMSRIECLCLNNLSFIFYNKSDFIQALECADKCLALSTQIGYKMGVEHSLNVLGNVYQVQSDGPKALDYYIRSLKIAQEIGNEESVAYCLNNIASVHAMQGDFSKAIDYYKKSLNVHRKINSKRGVALCLTNMGTNYLKIGEFDRALECHLQGLKLFEETGEKNGIARALKNLGAVCYVKNDYSKGLYYYKKSMEHSEESGDKQGIAFCLISIGSGMLEQGKLNEAARQTEKALEISQEIRYPEAIRNASKALKKIYEKQNKFKEALAMEELYIAMRDSVSNEESKRSVLKKQFQFENEIHEKEKELLAQENKIQSLQLSQNKFLMFALGSLVLIVIGVSILLIKQNKLRNQQNEMCLEQKLLRSQMNPHFIFNSLQAIQKFIGRNDATEASRHLSAFGDLTRAVLENSRYEVILLSKEIKLLQNYLDIQKVIYGNKFNFSISVDEDLDPNTVSIPPMMAQPFIENAIEHGINGIMNGLIEVNISKDKDFITIEIKDNGQGIKSENNSKHLSLATEITAERISLINKKNKHKASFDITEAFPTQLNRGVKALFKLPVSYA